MNKGRCQLNKTGKCGNFVKRGGRGSSQIPLLLIFGMTIFFQGFSYMSLHYPLVLCDSILVFCFSISHSFLLVLYFIQQLLFVDLLPTISHIFLLLSSYHYFYHLLFTFLFPCSMDFHLQGKENESSKDHFCRNWIPFCFSDFTFQRRVLFLHQIQTQVFILPFCHSANNFLQFN